MQDIIQLYPVPSTGYQEKYSLPIDYINFTNIRQTYI